MSKDEIIAELRKVLSDIQWDGCLCAFPENIGCSKCYVASFDSERGHTPECPVGIALKHSD